MWSHLLLYRRVDWKNSLLESTMASFPFIESVGGGRGKAWDQPLPVLKEGRIWLSGTNSNACRPAGSEKDENEPMCV